MRQCRVCGGTYRPVDDQGFEYFHVCATLPALGFVQAGRKISPETFGRLAVTRLRRPGARDENTDTTNGRAGFDTVPDDLPLDTPADIAAYLDRQDAKVLP